jgi:glycosyltransferase involved in cell wall biosynthesis
MKVVCFIDSLDSGGAQRQLVTIAVELKKRGHEVRFLLYHEKDHFLPLLQAANISCIVIPSCSHVQRIIAVRRILRKGWQDVVLAFLEGASFYAELASIPFRRWGLVVGERLADPGMKNGLGLWLRRAHCLADVIVCNSHTNKLMLESLLPFLKDKLCTVYNTVNFNMFRSISDNSRDNLSDGIFRIVVAAGFQEKKNMMNLAKALLILKNKHDVPAIVLDWYGSTYSNQTPYKQIELFVAENGLSKIFRLHKVTRDIANEFSCADAIGLFSFYEGLPNAVCEGMACGKPILLSNVCDAGNLVYDGKNGFLCDPASPEDIADKIQRMVFLSHSERQKMGLESRRIAEDLFSSDIVINRYELILMSAINNKKAPVDYSWPKYVPESSVKTVKRWFR